MEIKDLGRKPYREVWDKQLQLSEALIDGRGSEEVLMVEHNHVYTLGLHGKAENMLLNEGQLKERGIEFIHIERGGDITYHGPGQIVVYPIINLKAHKLGVKDYVHLLEQIVIDFLATYEIESGRVEGATGVWLGIGTPAERKICAIGVKCSHFVTRHGFALNINTDLSYFSLINPCGFVDKGVTSLSVELGKPVDMDEAKERLRGIINAALA
jgi:lipoyl(octanoyl) transferase